MYQVNTKYCLRKVCLDSLHPSPMGALVNLYEILLYKTAARCPLYPVFPSLCASGVGLKFFLGAESFSRSLPAQMSQVAAVPLERGGSGIRSSCPRGSLCFWFAQTCTTMRDIGWDIDPELSPLHTHWHRQHLEGGWKWNEIMHDNHDIPWHTMNMLTDRCCRHIIDILYSN